jgi:hypothetical protein
MSMVAKALAWLALPLGLLGCSAACPREGCDALERRVGDSGTESRIAGVIASESDVVANDCQECGFASAQVSAWHRDGDGETTDIVKEQTSGPAQLEAQAGSDGKYVLELEPGDYWVCAGIACFGASVVEGRTTTLNIKLINGISSGFLGLPGKSGVTRVAGIERSPS